MADRRRDVQAWLNSELARSATEHQVPGAAVAVLIDGAVAEAATGVLNQRTGVKATTDSVFQIGSITKLWTATLIQQLADEGKLDLDAPARTYLPELRIGGTDADDQITVRRLLCHTGGFEGDIFEATTTGEDAVQRFVEDVLPGVPQHFAPGELYSYSNAGYVALGRIIEVLRGRPWAAALREHLLDPLGLERAATSADEAILYRAAIGHVRPTADAPLEPTRTWPLVHSNGPAGSMLAMSARDLLAFARLQLSGGVGPKGERLVDESALAGMREPIVDQPAFDERPTRRGLGWTVFDWDGGRVFGHNGGTVGQAAYFRIVPEQGIAIALLTNGGRGIRLYQEVFGHVMRAYAGIEVPPLPEPPAEPVSIADPQRYVGRYEVRLGRTDVEVEDGELWATQTRLAQFSANAPFEPVRSRLIHTGGERFVTAGAPWGVHEVTIFGGDDGSGRAAYLHTSRAVPRVQ